MTDKQNDPDTVPAALRGMALWRQLATDRQSLQNVGRSGGPHFLLVGLPGAASYVEQKFINPLPS